MSYAARPAEPAADSAAETLRTSPRIGFVLAALNTGGAERHAVLLRQRLARRGVDAFLLAVARAKSGALARTAGADAIELQHRRVLSSPAAWLDVARFLRRRDPEVVLTVNPACAILVALLRLLGVFDGKVACIFHTTVVQPNERRSFSLFRRLAPRLDALVYVSAAQQRFWEERGLRARRSFVITNGVDLQNFVPDAQDRAATRGRMGLADHDYVIGIVAALRPEKRHTDLVGALARLRDRALPAKLLIVGDGDERARIEGEVARAGLEADVIFAGEQPDVRPFVRACDVCVLCSAIETFSLAALEVLALGVPLVASDVGAMGEIVQDGTTGLLYDVGDVAALAGQLERLSAPELRASMSAAARSSVARFDYEVMLDRYVELLDEVAGS